MLEKLKDDFKAKKTELEEDEMKAEHAFQQIIQQLTDNVDKANHEIAKKKTLNGEAAEAKAEAEGNLAQTTADKKEDETYLDDTTALCAQKTTDFKSRQKLRAEEIEAIN